MTAGQLWHGNQSRRYQTKRPPAEPPEAFIFDGRDGVI